MGETTLVEARIADSVTLLGELDRRGQNPSAAAWYFYEDAEQWRLLIAGPTFDALLPKQEAVAYRMVAEAIMGLSLSSLGVSEVKVLQTKAPLLQALARLFYTGPKAIMQAQFSNTSINGIFIKEMLILRSGVEVNA